MTSFKSVTENIKTGCGYIHFTHPVDGCKGHIKLSFKKSGSCEHAICEALTDAINWSIEKGYDMTDLLEKWKGIRCEKPTLVEGGGHLSCPDAIAKSLMKIREDK